jgi:hypothetical protein
VKSESFYSSGHKDDPDYEPYQQERELRRAFAKRYGLDYYEGLRWSFVALTGAEPPVSRERAGLPASSWSTPGRF